MMRVFGLTGGIGCGKTSVARMLEKRGARIIDADQVARDVVQPGLPAHREIVESFGRDVLAPDGALDRAALGEVVFCDKEARHRLNAITHPRIAAWAARRLSELREQGASLAIYEAALLVETGAYRMHNGLIVVSAPLEVQLQRLIERDSIGEEAARKRIASQLPMEEKLAVADYTIDNSGTWEETEKAVDRLWEKLQADAKR